MFPVNFWINFIIALIPLAVGAVWYGPLFGKPWQRESGVSDAQLADTNALKLYGLFYLYSFLFVTFLPTLVMHQTGLSGLFGMLPEWSESGSALWHDLNVLDEKYGMYTRHLHFGHGAIHGIMGALFIVAPVICIHGLFERKSWKFMLIHVGYWIVIMALMGGAVCEFLEFRLPL